MESNTQTAQTKLLLVADVELSPREAEVMALVYDDQTAKEIGETLYLSARTVEWHITNVVNKVSSALGEIISKRQKVAKILKAAKLI